MNKLLSTKSVSKKRINRKLKDVLHVLLDCNALSVTRTKFSVLLQALYVKANNEKTKIVEFILGGKICETLEEKELEVLTKSIKDASEIAKQRAIKLSNVDNM